MANIQQVIQHIAQAPTAEALKNLELSQLLTGIEGATEQKKIYTVPLVLNSIALESARDSLANAVRYGLDKCTKEEQTRIVAIVQPAMGALQELTKNAYQAVVEVGHSYNRAKEAGLIKSSTRLEKFSDLAIITAEEADIAVRVQEGTKCGGRGKAGHHHKVDPVYLSTILPSGANPNSAGSVSTTTLEGDVHDARSSIVGPLLFVEYLKFEEISGKLESSAKDVAQRHPDLASFYRDAARVLKAVYESSRVLYTGLAPNPIKLNR